MLETLTALANRVCARLDCRRKVIVRRIRRDAVASDGWTYMYIDRATITLNVRLGPERLMEVLAHELAHVILFDTKHDAAHKEMMATIKEYLHAANVDVPSMRTAVGAGTSPRTKAKKVSGL